ncbi:Crp/Fnr family transcriptional regulator [Caldimonas tepidiphila]|uniref:Crp/Fnr family transcriptional regulator n=1 Tax=Caldimonas tepidiphila TaxID=2315841 RepID=UPI001F0CD284|nr:Crp/Fnr family transcriptional regulator [Caldimonas tepidiphila]
MSAALLNLLSHLPLFQSVSPQQLASLLGSVSERRLAKGECLFRRGDPANCFYGVAYGQVKLAIPSPQGAEKVVEIIGPRQSLGEAVMFLGKPFPVTAEALEDSLLLRIDRDAVDRLLAEDPSFARRMLAGLSVRLHSLLRDVETYSLRSSAQRVIGYLLQHAGEDGAADAALSIELPTAKQVIASRLNLTPETLSRVFAELSRAGLIEVQGRTIAVASLRRLREFEP